MQAYAITRGEEGMGSVETDIYGGLAEGREEGGTGRIYIGTKKVLTKGGPP